MSNFKPTYETTTDALTNGEYRLQAWLTVLNKLNAEYTIEVNEYRMLLKVTCDGTPEFFKLIQDGVDYEEQVIRYSK